jgi:hypothetical protein
MTQAFVQADAGRLPFPDKSFDLVLGSPPYADARTYGIGAQRKCQAWIEWMLEVTREAVRVSRGLVLWVCAGVTRDHCYWPGPEGLLYEWWKAGGRCWRPCFWHRVGIPGSGGKQWLRADVEYVLAFTGCEKAVPWADNTANGHPPVWAAGGGMSYRNSEGKRKNAVPRIEHGSDGDLASRAGVKTQTRRKPNGDRARDGVYVPPAFSNPGVLIKGIKVGGGLLGSKLAHENEAPYPQRLAEWFVRGWCPPGGTVLDPFSGSGTTVAAALALGRSGVGSDLRFSQCELGRRRCAEVQMELLG